LHLIEAAHVVVVVSIAGETYIKSAYLEWTTQWVKLQCSIRSNSNIFCLGVCAQITWDKWGLVEKVGADVQTEDLQLTS
jgi:hypothetical protein